MREIKFRAYVIATGEIDLVTQITFEERWLKIATSDDWRMFNEVELMQYTGLKDMNGVEIYEGDVVKAIPVYSDLTPFVGILTIGTQRITISGKTYDHELYDYKVIGHKYQYPELLGVG